MTTPLQKERLPRFERITTVPFRLQERDIEILRRVYQHRFLTSQHICVLVSGSPQKLLRRLHVLFHNGFLERPPEQRYWPGNNPMIYGLANEGARVLSEHLGIPIAKTRWTIRNRTVQERYLKHTISVSHFMTCVEMACKDRKNVTFIPPEEIFTQNWLEKKGRGDRNNPLSWRVRTTQDNNRTQYKLDFYMVPDAVFALRVTSNPKRKRIKYFFVEADRGSMPVVRSNLQQTSFYKKMIGYWKAKNQDTFKHRFNFPNVRVLTITTSPVRIEHMIEANKKVDERRKGSRLFYFAPADIFTLEDPQTIFKPVWQNGRGEDSMSLIG